MKISLIVLSTLWSIYSFSQAPAGYYNTTTGLSCAPLKTALKTIITTGHVNQGYNALWTQYLVSDVKPREVAVTSAQQSLGVANSSHVIWDIYSDNPSGADPYNLTPGPVSSGGQQDDGSLGGSEGQRYNREHTVPSSWHTGNNTSFSGTDYHHVFPTDKKVNNDRGNLPYGTVGTTNLITLNGSKRGGSAVAGITGTVFEPIDSFKGDVARAFLYFVTRYEDDMASWASNAEAVQAFEPNTFPSVDIPYLRLMLQWNNLDPVSRKEIDRNNAAYAYQGNRNPYVDRPEFVGMVWNSTCPGLGALPVDILLFTGKFLNGKILLNWEVGTEVNVDRYEVERSFNGTRYSKTGEIAAKGSNNYYFTEEAETIRGRRLYYRLKKVDKDGRYTYSAVLSLHIPANTMFSIYPNPASTFVRLKFKTNMNGLADVIITDMAGKAVAKNLIQLKQGSAILSTDSLPSGIYQVKIYWNQEVFTERLQILK